jgi:hypothetical protein
MSQGQQSLFEPSLPPELSGVHLSIASILLDRRGKGLTKSKDIAKMVGLKHSCDAVHVLNELIDDFRLQIIADRSEGGGGYRFAESDEEFFEHQYAGLSQALTMFKRIRSRVGERRFRSMLIKLGIRDVVDLDALTTESKDGRTVAA